MLTRLPRLAIARLHHRTSTYRFSSTMSKDGHQAQESSSSATTAPKDATKMPLPLPAPEQDSGAADKGDGVTSLRVGESVRLDAMGPLVVNTDGTMGRIGNWAGMTEGEKAQTLKLLGRRNKQRLEAIKAKKAEEEQK